MSAAYLVAGAMVISLAVYAITAGADFGGGIWDLFAHGPRRAEQRAVIARALAPIWEANHVWLIVVVVLFFVAFPMPFAVVSIRLHVPLVIMLVGIVLRGTAFVFRAYGGKPGTEQRVLGWVFAATSLFTPLMLGATLGGFTIIEPTGVLEPGTEWLQPFPILVGCMVVVAFAFLAAVYLTHETDDPALRDDFRWNALVAGWILPVLAWAALVAAASGAPRIWAALTGSAVAWAFHAITGAAGATAMFALWRRRFGLARVSAVATMVLIVLGWAVAQNPYLAYPVMTVEGSAAPDAVLWPALAVLGLGALLVLPGFLYLYRVFKGDTRDSASG